MAVGHSRVVFVGGGLANALAAFRLVVAAKGLGRPLAVQLLEREGALGMGGGPHTWCLHASDLGLGNAADAWTRHWLAPLVAISWSGYEVRFPGGRRELAGVYLAMTSGSVAEPVTRVLGEGLRLGCPVREVHPDRVVLASGEVLPADLVVDGRGAGPMAPVAYQKFHGLMVRTAAPHGLSRPILMDATVTQQEGFRFIYTLPFAADLLLVEDTRYSDRPQVGDWRHELVAYLAAAGTLVKEIVGEERGALALPLLGAVAPRPIPGVVGSGMGAGLFQPTTGYSAPDAVAFADWLSAEIVSGQRDWTVLPGQAAARAARHWQRSQFYRRLNNMLFTAASETGVARRRVLEQFYQRDPDLVARFYGGRLRPLDRLRILSGRPPVPVWAGLRAFLRPAPQLRVSEAARG